MNPFLQIAKPEAWGPGSLEMGLPVVEASQIKPGMRILEVGGGSGQIATTIAKHWDTTVVTLEPWTDGQAILTYAKQEGVENRVLPMKLKAQSLPFPDNSFDAVISIGSFEMIGDERPQALQEMVRVLRPGGRVTIAEPMCQPDLPEDLAVLDRESGMNFQDFFCTLDWNRRLFADHGLTVLESYYFDQAYTWWLEYRAKGKISVQEQDFIQADGGRWITLGLVSGQKG